MDYEDYEHLPSVVMEDFLAFCGFDLEWAVSRAAAGYGHVFAELYRDPGWGVTPGQLADHVAEAWGRYGSPLLSWPEWRHLFDLAGYREGNVPATRPAEPLLLWRGSVPEFRQQPSWTHDKACAAEFAVASPLQDRFPMGELWWAWVEPWRLLTRVDHWFEGEYVVDTDGLAIHNEAYGPF